MFLYVYMHLDPRTDAVRYIGVGPLQRAYDFCTRSKNHFKWLAELDDLGLEPRVALPSKTKDRNEAHEVEVALIKWHREQGSDLFNITAGGTGKSIALTEAQKRQLSEVHKAKWLFDPEFRARRLPDMAKARATRNRSPEHITAITKYARVQGAACKKCNGTLRYKVSRNCVNCAKRT